MSNFNTTFTSQTVHANTSESNSQTEPTQIAASISVRQSLIPRSNFNIQAYLTEPSGIPNSLSGNEYILSSNNSNSLSNIRAFMESNTSESGGSSAFEYIRNTINRIRESDSSYVYPPATSEINRAAPSSRPPVYHNRPNGVRSNNTTSSAARPQFRSKSVCALACKYCANGVCRRGMKAILLADMAVELFSTDLPPTGVALVNDDYQTRKCQCRIRDVACLGCGNVIGYHVTQPCQTCMEACNNGHFWMFHVDHVKSSERMNHTGTIPLLWANLSKPDHDIDKTDSYDIMCR